MLAPQLRCEINVEYTIDPLDRVCTAEQVRSDREQGMSFTCDKLRLFETVGQSKQNSMAVAVVDLTSLCRSQVDYLASERSTFQKM